MNEEFGILSGSRDCPPCSVPGDRTICVIGNLNIDLIIRGVRRLPNWGQEVMGVDHGTFSSGQAGYLAQALATLGCHVSVIGNVGADYFGEQVIADLRACGVDVGAIEVVKGHTTGITVGIVRPDGERAFISDLASLLTFDEGLICRHWDRVQEAKTVCLVGLFCLPGLPLSSVEGIMKTAAEEGKVTVLDTGWDPDNWATETVIGIRRLLQYVTVFMPNLDEVRALTGVEDPIEALVALSSLGSRLVVAKLGSKGSMAGQGDHIWSLPALATVVYDTVGAGDTFNAGFLLGMQMGLEVPACLALGNAAASIYISRRDKRYPSFSEVVQAASSYDVFRMPSQGRFDRGAGTETVG